jgi:DNA-binding transcriptional LysR family regulator
LRRYIKHGTLTQLSVFEAVARLGSFTRAAEELHMAQPTVSVQMKKLSETIGLPLFEQVGRRTRLTEAGREVYAACQDIFQKIVDVEGRLAGMRARPAERVRLAVTTTGKYFAPRLVGRFCAAHPGIEVSLAVLNRQALLHRLDADVDDLYVFSSPPEEGGVEVHRLMPNPLFVYARDDHPLAGRSGIPFSEVANQPFLMREPGSGTRAVAEAAFAAHGLAPIVRMELESNEAIKQAIVGGLGVSILSRHTMAPETRRGRIAALDVEGFPVEREWFLVRLSARPLSQPAKLLIDYALRSDVLSELAEAET